MHSETEMFLRIFFGTMGRFDWSITKNILNPTPSKTNDMFLHVILHEHVKSCKCNFLHLHLHGVYIYIYIWHLHLHKM